MSATPLSMLSCIFFVLILNACGLISTNIQEHDVQGKWQIMAIISQPVFEDVTFEEFDDSPPRSGSVFFRTQELNATLELLENYGLVTSLMYANFGTPKWTMNSSQDSLTLLLANVQEESLIADGTVGRDGNLILYEGKITFLDSENIDWTLTDGRIFKLKRLGEASH